MRLYLHVWMSMHGVQTREKRIRLAKDSLDTSRWDFLKSHQVAQPIILPPPPPLKDRYGHFGVTAKILLMRKTYFSIIK